MLYNCDAVGNNVGWFEMEGTKDGFSVELKDGNGVGSGDDVGSLEVAGDAVGVCVGLFYVWLGDGLGEAEGGK